MSRAFSSGHLPVFSLSPEEDMIKEQVSRFARERVQPLVRTMDEKAQLDPELLKEMFAQGLMGVEIPSQYGGSEMSFTSSLLVVEELAKVDAAVSVVADVHNTLINNMFGKWGSQALKEEYLPRLASDMVGAFCLSEPSSGSDAFALKTRADRDGDYFVLNGSKLWITNGEQAGVFLVMANVDFSLKHKGITCFVVDRDTQGFTIGKKEDKLGIRASSTCPIALTDVRVHKDKIMGEEGKGYIYAINMLNEGRIGIGAQMVGLAQGAFEATMPYLFQRKQFNTFIGDFQAMQAEYAQVATEIQAARLLVYNAARMKEQGEDFVQMAAMAKLYASQVAEKSASKSIEWMGGLGFSKEYPQEKFYRDCKVGAIYEGTSIVQRTTIAKLLSAKYR